MTATVDTREMILDVAQELVQTLGFEGFSYADVAERVGIRKASIHHHFPTKSGLGVELLRRFRADCQARLSALAVADPLDQLLGYVGIFRETLRSGRMCLCGILAAEFVNLSDEVREALLVGLADQEIWLARVFERGQGLGRFRRDVGSEVLSRNFLSGLEGGLLLARVHGDAGRFEEAVARLMDGVALDRTPAAPIPAH